MAPMPRPADSASRLVPALGAVGGAALALITLAYPGATRMHAWPWNLAYLLALIAPVAALLLRMHDRSRPLVVPRQPWLLAIVVAAAAILLSALTSPYRGPSLLWSSPLLAGLAVFLVLFDWLHRAPDPAVRRLALFRAMGVFLAIVAVVSLGRWAAGLPGLSFAQIVDARNPYPLGHSNYTAGLALLLLPAAAALAWSSSGRARWGWSLAAVLALALLVTSGSRGGLIGLAVLLFAALAAARLGWKKTLALAAAAVVAALLLAFAHPRTRAMFRHADPSVSNVSNVQRQAMFEAGCAMGTARPLLGWGPGTTPLAFPRFRADLKGGVEDVLQLHSLPVQLWAELGAAGLVGLAALLVFAWRHTARFPAAAVALAGYLGFALTDYQLDVPVFAFALAAFAALLAPPAAPPVPATPTTLDWIVRLALVAFAGFARSDPSPGFNVRALALAPDATHHAEAVELLNLSLALNPDQEIAHFNLGWLLVVERPDLAERHFLAAAHLVPDKGGVYFGLGLARLNQGRRPDAAAAFALECVNDPAFLVSPWWRDPVIGTLRPATVARARQLLAAIAAGRAVAGTAEARDAAYLDGLGAWLVDTARPGQMLALANTSERAAYFARRTPRPDFAAAPVRAYRRERTGYPVLMRNLDLDAPLDVFVVQENTLAIGEYRFLFPAKGWLPGTLLVNLLDHPDLFTE